MFRWLVEERLSINAITYRLRDYGVPTPSGRGFWIRSTVAHMLKNPAYYGKTYAFTVTYGEPKKRIKPNARNKKTGIMRKPIDEWLEIPNATPPIISEELFEAAQKQLQKNKETSLRNAKNQYLLRGHVYCRRCGRGYWAAPGLKTRNNRRYSYPFYGCSGNHKIVSPVKCGNPRVSALKLEPLVWKQIKDVLSKPELVMAEIQRRQKEASDVTNVERDLERVETQIANREKQRTRTWKAFAITGDEETFKTSIAGLGEEIRMLQQEKERLQEWISASSQYTLSVEDIKKACVSVKRNVKGLGFEDKRLALEALQIKVLIDGDDISIEGAIPIAEGNIETMPSG